MLCNGHSGTVGVVANLSNDEGVVTAIRRSEWVAFSSRRNVPSSARSQPPRRWPASTTSLCFGTLSQAEIMIIARLVHLARGGQKTCAYPSLP
jgi:hypothetical protein